MPVDVIKKLGVSNSPVTCDYSTLQSWSAALPTDLTTTRTNTVAGSSTTSSINLDASASATDGFYTGHTLTISGETRLITAYVGATKTATVGSWNGSSGTYSSAPISGTSYTVDDVRWIGECYDQGTFTVSTGQLLQISGPVADSTRNIIVRCAAGASFNAKSGVRTTALAFNASNGVNWISTGNSSGPLIGVQYTVLDGIQYKYNGLYGSSPQMTSNCVWKNGIADNKLEFTVTDTTALIVNSLIVSSANGVRRGTVRNCTIVHSGSAGNGGLYPEYPNAQITYNTAVFNFSNLYIGAGGPAAEDYNATDLSGTWPLGTHDLVNLTYANQFVSAGSDWRAVATGSLKAGTPDSFALTDITGLTRDTTTPYIGCWEVASGGTAQSINAAPGSYTETGAVQTQSLGLSLNAVAGSVSVTGLLANGKLGLNLVAIPDVYTITGQPVPGNIVTATLNLVPGSYGLTGSPTGALSLFVVANAGSYGLIGNQAYLKGPLDPAFPSTSTYNGDFITEI